MSNAAPPPGYQPPGYQPPGYPPPGYGYPPPGYPPPPRQGMSTGIKVLLVLAGLAAVMVVAIGVAVAVGIGRASHNLAKAGNALTPDPGRPAGYGGPAYPGMIIQDHVADGSGRVEDFGETVTAGPLARMPALFGVALCSAVTITNRSEQTKSFSPLEWKLQEPDGTVQTVGFTGTFKSGQIAPGGSANGTVCFSDTPQSGTFVLLWQPFTVRADRGVWLSTL